VAVIIDKEKTKEFRGNREDLYNAAVVQLMELVWEQHLECQVLIHQRHDKQVLRNRLTQQLQQRARELDIYLPRSWVDHRRARGESGLEVADAIAYAFLRRQKGQKAFYQMIQDRVISEKIFRHA